MSTIPQNAVATVIVGDAQTVAGYSGALNASDVLSAVSAYLNGLGSYQVESSNQSGGILAAITPLIQETFQATLNIQVYYNLDTSQLASDVTQAFYTVTGQTPSNVTIPTFSSGGTPQATGQAAATNTATQGIADTISNFFTTLTSTAKSLLIGLAAVLIIVVALIAFGPNVGAIAARI